MGKYLQDIIDNQNGAKTVQIAFFDIVSYSKRVSRRHTRRMLIKSAPSLTTRGGATVIIASTYELL